VTILVNDLGSSATFAALGTIPPSPKTRNSKQINQLQHSHFTAQSLLMETAK
jgi:hypothetical protein